MISVRFYSSVVTHPLVCVCGGGEGVGDSRDIAGRVSTEM